MASKVDGQQIQDLVNCPVCKDVLKNAIILRCGHTFCRECLEAYDVLQLRRNHMICPVCRESTDLGQNRVAGLTPNFIARDIQDKLHEVDVDPSQSFCPLHKNIHNDIFCEDCIEFICLTCFMNSHKDHKIKKEEELEVGLKEKRDSLIRESEMRKAQIEEFVNNAEQCRTDSHGHFSKVEKEIKDDFAKRVAILQQKLLNKLDSIRKDTENQFEVCITNQRQAIDDINNSTTILRGYTGRKVDSNAIKTQYLQSSKLEKSLKRSIDTESIARLKHTAESTQFCPSDEKLRALGHIKVGMEETSHIQKVNNASVRQVEADRGMADHSQDAVEVNTAPGAKTKSDPPARKRVSIIPWFLRNKSLKIVRQVKAPKRILGMAALSQDAVVVGYGCDRRGSDRFLVSGEKTQHLQGEVGGVYDIAFLTDGRSVVSRDVYRLRVYSTDGHSTGMQYTCKEGPLVIRLCVDQDNNIYAVNGNPEIYIFRGSNPNPRRVISTGDIKPRLICVTKTGALITSTCTTTPSTVTVFDREGHVGTRCSIVANDSRIYLSATLDSEDRVLVARVRYEYDEFRGNRYTFLGLTRYTLRGTKLTRQVAFNELKLEGDINLSYVTSLKPALTAITHYKKLYFIEHAE